MVVASLPEPLRGDRQHVLLDGEVVGVGIDARQVDVDDEAVAITVGVERHGRSPEALARRDEAVELTERIEPHKHLERTSWWSSSGTPSGYAPAGYLTTPCSTFLMVQAARDRKSTTLNSSH